MHLMKNENPIMHGSPSALKSWVLAARPKTLIASISPVVIAAVQVQALRWDLFFLCLCFSVCIQIGANFANDYFDYLKGADTSQRIGPARAAQSGWLTLPALRKGISVVFTLAALISLPLLFRGGFWGVCVVVFSILFAIWYTGGKRPLGYLGLGELLVLVFYGPVAVLGSYYVLTLQMNALVVYSSLPPGLLACSILIANNLRDEISDRAAQKRTLVVRFGRTFGQWEYAASILFAGLFPLWLALSHRAPISWAFLALILPAAFPALKRAFTAASPQELIPLLPASARLLALYTVGCLVVFLL
ncbi:MAG: 1,4-dihydroxy-2-naphthoate octaprenyltransferase [Chlamydiales bacterium]|nr:1,4-dihydroxy-2-naphthoate octaprenyltransferase [Chlamydiales bacterium]